MKKGLALAGILIWFCVAFAIFLFGFGSFIFCRKDGFRKTFGRQQTETKATDATITNTNDFDREVSEGSTENGRPDIDQVCGEDDSTDSIAITKDPSCGEGNL